MHTGRVTIPTSKRIILVQPANRGTKKKKKILIIVRLIRGRKLLGYGTLKIVQVRDYGCVWIRVLGGLNPLKPESIPKHKIGFRGFRKPGCVWNGV